MDERKILQGFVDEIDEAIDFGIIDQIGLNRKQRRLLKEFLRAAIVHHSYENEEDNEEFGALDKEPTEPASDRI